MTEASDELRNGGSLDERIQPDARDWRVGSSLLTISPVLVNDDRWCELVGRELGVKKLAFVRSGYAARFGAVITVDATADLLGDPAIVELVRRALAYRKTRGCIIESGTNRLVVDVDQPIVAKVDGRTLETDDPVAVEDLDAMASGRCFPCDAHLSHRGGGLVSSLASCQGAGNWRG